MENTQDINSILAKLKKLQRLYEGAKAINSEAEAQNAAVKIQNLLTQYNLSMADLEAVPDNEQAWLEALRSLINDSELRHAKGQALHEWQQRHYLLGNHVDAWFHAIFE